ncbi:DUF962 domain-containing protein [Thalassotalea sp. PP2-459]|uniref:DUF962 domain-containing protein n=1 Tax=Thalassotalea sp. PP2-459 TaxID=1742724 RepID=UPI0009437BC3|nr:DUF962 domain-containing protein [Thalassotalea sp. PP2-459]OKY25325.1 hypothetical protein BI291_03035 [Thalassotalea sp. PP2-459]
MAEKTYQSFADFYPFYLSQHKNKTCRRLHFMGSLFVLILLMLSIFTQHWLYLFYVPIAGYGFAWIGHFFYEKNKPATFSYPIYSLIGDWVMFKDILLGKVKL